MLSTKDLKDLFGESGPDKAILKAQRLVGKGRNDQAVDVIQEAIGRLGEFAELRIELATLHLSAGRSRDAAESLRSLLKANAAETPRVEEFIAWARTQFSDIEPLHEAMAEGHVARRNFNAAVTSLEQIDKKTLEAALQSRLSNLNRFLSKGAAVPKSALPTLYFAALAYEAVGDWQRALECYRKVLAASGSELPQVDERLKALVARHYKLTALRLAYAEILQEAGQAARAREESLKALEIDARCAPLVSQRLKMYLETAPGDPELLWATARVSLAEGRIDETLAVCRDLIDRQSHLPQIEKLLEELNTAEKGGAAIQLLLARVAQAQGKVSRAVSAVVAAMGSGAGQSGVTALEKLVEAFPNEPRGYQILGDHYLKEGRVDRCLEIFKALRKVDPDSSPSIAARLQAVLAADPADTAARSLLEEVCVEAGDAQGAVPFLRRRLRESPDQAAEVLARLRPMMVSAPADRELKLAAAETCLVLKDSSSAWTYLRDLADAAKPPESAFLHLLVLCAGDSAELHRKISSHLTATAPKWAGHPEVAFALAESAGRAGQLREAVDRYRSVARTCPEAASVCSAAISSLGRSARGAGGEECAALAEALLDAGDVAAATEALRGVGTLPAAGAARLADRFSAALRSDPKNIALSTGLAGVCLASGQTARALEIARAGIAGREDAASAPLTMVYGDAQMRAGKAGEAAKAYAAVAKRDPALVHDAIERLRRVLELDSALDTAHIALGRLLINEGSIPEGVQELLAAWAINSTLAAIILKDLDRTARRHPGEPALDFGRAKMLLAANEPAAAAEAIGRLIGSDPGLTDEILTKLEEISARHPMCARAQLELGRAYCQKRWAARASACLLKAYELDHELVEAVAVPLADLLRQFPDVPEALVARARLYEGEGKPGAAAEWFARAAELGGIGASGALAGLRRVCAAKGSVPARAHLLRARTCGILGDVAEAVEAARVALDADRELAGDVRSELDRLVGANPYSAAARLGRAAASVRLVDGDAAVKDLREAQKLDPECCESVAALAREILQRRPSMIAATRVLADSLALAGDVQGAAVALDAALANAEGAKDIELILARRSLALRGGDREMARALMSRAAGSTSSRDKLLEKLHDEVLAAPAEARRADAAPPEVIDAMARGNYFAAGEMLESVEPTLLKAWILERSGRQAEAAACLQGMLHDPRAAARFAALHDLVLSREIDGKAPALIAETWIRFDRPEAHEQAKSPSSQAQQSRSAAKGGAG